MIRIAMGTRELLNGIFYHCGIEVIQRILLITQEVVNEFLRIFSTMVCLTSNESFDFGVDPDHDPDPGIFKGIFAIAR